MNTKKTSFFKKGILVTIILSIMLIFPLNSLAAIANPNSEISPLWVNIATLIVDISFSENIGVVSADAGRVYGVTESMEGTLTIYRKEGFRWVTVKSETASSTRSLFISFTFNAIQGATYKAVFDVTAYGPTVDETESISKIETYQ